MGINRIKQWTMGWLAMGLFSSALAGELPAVKILTSFYPIYIATLNVAGDVPGVEVKNLTRPFTGCLHDYQLTPNDLKTMAQAGILVVNGAGMESFLESALQQAPQLKLVQASEGIELISGGAEGENPHVWVSISDYIRQVQNIAGGLAAADPAHAGVYQQNAGTYIEQLELLKARMHESLQDISTRDIITFHEAFPYFAREFDLTVVAVIEREPGSEPSARELAETVKTIRRKGIQVLFAEPQYSSRAAETIARETGSTVFTLDPAVTGPLDKDAYLRIMEANLRELQKALK
ncbi:MAG TPA: zinc ABC transporter substrate-binding protein [Verrucomicrobia bacterium]|nr:MAG: metal ABC transporter substrate-binding protein [Lentisphaerae bacterium GWF2_57_35]HBA83769.1 zinc ABC transporter substrate-binding protein [Verrucomicrobiota bacterium]